MTVTNAKEIRQALKDKGFDSRQIGELSDLLAQLLTTNDAQATSVTNLNAWATALATKLNADAGVTDVNYDTNPQA